MDGGYPPCDDPDDAITIPRYLFYAHSVTTVSLPINLFGIYCILSKSAPKLGNYRWLLLNYQVCVLALDLALNVGFVPLLYCPVLGLSVHGLFMDLHLSAKAQISVIAVMTPVTCVSIIQLFIHRHQCIVGNASYFKTKSKMGHVLIHTIHYLVYGFFLLPLPITAPSDQTDAQIRAVQRISCVPAYFFTDRVLIVQNDRSLLVPACISFLVILFILEWISIALHGAWSLTARTNHMSNATKRLQKMYMIALCIQVTIPMLTVGIPVIYFVCSLYRDTYKTQLALLFLGIAALHGIASTVALIAVDRNYRRFCLVLISKYCNQQP